MINQKVSIHELEQLFTNKENDNLLKDYCLELCSGIVNNQRTLLDVVESLKDFLTSTDLNRHNHGLHFLGNVIESLPPNVLAPKEVEFVTDFFCGQIRQHHSFISASLKGLVTLVKNPSLPRNTLHDISSTLFNNVVWQTQTVTDRMVFYLILQYIVFNRLEDYQSTSSELLFNIISSADGERDPRNLLILFSFLPKLFSSISLGTLTEDAFEVVSCYFPIDFHSSSEPGSVTREDLVSALNPCLLAHPDFAALCLPLIQEKLESALKSAKIDSYNLLVEAAEVWPAHVVAPYLQVLWQAIKADVLPPRDTQTSDAAIHALKAIVRNTKDPYLTSFLTSIVSCCEVFLSDVQLSMFEPSFRLLLSIMQANLTVCTFISQQLLPKLISLLKATQENLCDLILEKLTDFIETCLQMSPNFDFGGEVWREVVSCTGSTPQAYNAVTLGIAHVDQQCRLMLYQNITAHLTSPFKLRSSCIKCLQAMAAVYEEEVEEHVLKKISLLDEGKDLSQVKKDFEIICSLGIVEKFHQSVDSMCAHLGSRGGPYLSIAISGLRNLLETEDCKCKTLFNFLLTQSSLVPTLLSLHTDGDDLLNAATVVRILMASQQPSDQATYALPYAKSLMQHSNQIHKMVFLEALVGSLWPDVTVLTPEEIKNHIIPVAFDSFDTELARTSALQLLSSIINKSNDDSVLELVTQSYSTCTDGNKPVVCAYVARALILRSHPSMKHWIDKLLELLDSENEQIAEAAAEGFHLIVQESATSQSHAVVKLLYRQHLFYIVMPRLVMSVGKLQHLKALSYLLQAVPHTVFMSKIKEILPLLVRSLDLVSESLLLTVLNTLAHLLAADPSLLQDHVDTFIPRFLQLSRHSLFMQVRISALKCLSSSLKLPPILLLPHKQQVIAELVYCLDDKKRLVRKEAAHTRSKWYLLGAPTPD